MLVFDFAYPSAGSQPFVDKDEWLWREKHRRRTEREAYVSRPFPSHKVNDWMINKAYFVESSRAYIANQNIDTSTAHSPSSYLGYCPKTSSSPCGLLNAFVVEMRCGTFDLEAAIRQPKLRRLHIANVDE